MIIKNIKNSQNGFTIIEMIVAMGIFIVILAIAVGGFLQAMRTQRGTVALLNTNNNLSLVLEQMAREIRTGFNFCSDPSFPCSSSDSKDGLFQFYNANGQDVVYAIGSNSNLSNSNNITSTALYRIVNGGTPQQLTASTILVKSFNVFIPPNANPGFVTFSLGISPNDPEFSNITFYIQTSVSSRVISSQ